MLILTRRRGETIMIGDGIEVKVLRVGQDAVRLGIEAPPEVTVHRREVYEQIRAENRAAAQTTGPVETLANRVRQITEASPADERELSKHQ